MLSFSFSKLLDTASRLVWKHKILWALAFFVAEGGWYGISNYAQLGDVVDAVQRGEITASISVWQLQQPAVLSWFIGGGILLIVLALISEIARIATIQSLQHLRRGEPVSFWASFGEGTRKFLPMVLLDVMVVVPSLVLLAVVVLSMWSHLTVVSVGALLLLILYALFLLSWRHFAYCYIVFEDRSPFVALSLSVRLVRLYWREAVWLVVGRVLFGLGMTIGTVIAVVLSLIPFALLVFLMVLVAPWVVSYVIAVIGVLCSLTVLILIKGWRTAFVYTVMTEAYWKLKGTGEEPVQS